MKPENLVGKFVISKHSFSNYETRVEYDGRPDSNTVITVKKNDVILITKMTQNDSYFKGGFDFELIDSEMRTLYNSAPIMFFKNNFEVIE